MEYSTCDDYPTPEYKIPIETRLVRCLRLWRDNPNATLADDRTIEQVISGLLEWFICGCIAYDPSDQLRGWWSDGVTHLQIEETETDYFKLMGVTWIGSKGIAPFEIDVALVPGFDEQFAKCAFRLGMLDHNQHPTVCDSGLAASRVLAMRPRYNRDWAMAVELTPLDET